MGRNAIFSMSVTNHIRPPFQTRTLYASFDDSTAASISLCVDFGTRVTTSLVAGSCRSIHSVACDSTILPSINSFVVAGDLLEYSRWAPSRNCSGKWFEIELWNHGVVDNVRVNFTHMIRDHIFVRKVVTHIFTMHPINGRHTITYCSNHIQFIQIGPHVASRSHMTDRSSSALCVVFLWDCYDCGFGKTFEIYHIFALQIISLKTDLIIYKTRCFGGHEFPNGSEACALINRNRGSTHL